MSVWLDCVADAPNIRQVTIDNDSGGRHDFYSWTVPGCSVASRHVTGHVREADLIIALSLPARAAEVIE